MAPSQTIRIAVVGDMFGNHKLCIIQEFALPPQEIARFRAAGQVDCGKRQTLRPLEVPEQARENLKRLDLIEDDSDFLSFIGPESRTEAERAAKEICRLLPQYQLSAVDRSIPCM